MHSIGRKLAPLVGPLLLGPALLLAYRDGPPPGFTGGFGGMDCSTCHGDNPVDAPGGTLTVNGLPDQYQPGAAYQVTVRVEREDLRAGGFQIAARFSEESAGQQAGSWQIVDERVQVTKGGRDNTVEFASQTEAGAAAEAAGANSWMLEWTAPPADRARPVVFHVAANAANDDASALGDWIYTRELFTSPAR